MAKHTLKILRCEHVWAFFNIMHERVKKISKISILFEACSFQISHLTSQRTFGLLAKGLSRPYHFNFFKGCLPQILLGPFLNTLTHLLLKLLNFLTRKPWETRNVVGLNRHPSNLECNDVTRCATLLMFIGTA